MTIGKNTTQSILYKKEGNICIITLNRPAQYNAFTLQMRQELLEALGKASNDTAVRAIVLTGNGKGFSAGADLNEMAAGGVSPLDVKNDLMLSYANIIKRIIYMDKPVIAAINGPCAGAALGLALACDFKFMADTASLRYAFINIALVPDAGSSWFLVRSLGYNKALEIILSGEKIPAAECHRLGIINRVLPKESLMETAIIFAQQLANGPAKAIAGTKRILQYGLTHSLNDTMDIEAEEQAKCIFGPDNMEGVQAFLEKRAPKFKEG